MTKSEELMRTFENLAKSQRAHADQIVAMAEAQGMALGDLRITVDYLREKATECDAAAEALRNGDAVHIEEL